MKRKKGIFVNGEWLGGLVVIDELFRTICNISPVIIKEFVQTINEINQTEEEVKITNFQYKSQNAMVIDFGNDLLAGNIAFNFETKDGELKIIDKKVSLYKGNQNNIQYNNNSNQNNYGNIPFNNGNLNGMHPNYPQNFPQNNPNMPNGNFYNNNFVNDTNENPENYNNFSNSQQFPNHPFPNQPFQNEQLPEDFQNNPEYFSNPNYQNFQNNQPYYPYSNDPNYYQNGQNPYFNNNMNGYSENDFINYQQQYPNQYPPNMQYPNQYDQNPMFPEQYPNNQNNFQNSNGEFINNFDPNNNEFYDENINMPASNNSEQNNFRNNGIPNRNNPANNNTYQNNNRINQNNNMNNFPNNTNFGKNSQAPARNGQNKFNNTQNQNFNPNTNKNIGNFSGGNNLNPVRNNYSDGNNYMDNLSNNNKSIFETLNENIEKLNEKLDTFRPDLLEKLINNINQNGGLNNNNYGENINNNTIVNNQFGYPQFFPGGMPFDPSMMDPEAFKQFFQNMLEENNQRLSKFYKGYEFPGDDNDNIPEQKLMTLEEYLDAEKIAMLRKKKRKRSFNIMSSKEKRKNVNELEDGYFIGGKKIYKWGEPVQLDS